MKPNHASRKQTIQLNLRSLIAFMFLNLFVSTVAAGLVLNPQRIVLEDRDRSAALELLNTDDTMGRYQVYFEHKMMREDGSIVDIENPETGGPYSSDMIRYSPRRVDIEAGGSQTIRLAVRRPKDLEKGEYLSHLVLKQIPNKSPAQIAESSNPSENKQLNLSVQPILKLAIPVIVRKGKLEASSNISDIELQRNDGNIDAIHFNLHRTGNRSLYGNVEIYLQHEGKLGDRIGFVRGIALYDPTPKRLVKVKLDTQVPPDTESLLVRFDESGKYGGNILVEKTVTVK